MRSAGRLVITGMPGVGKTAVAAKVALAVAPAPKIFWHTFRAGEGVDLLLWELAGFAAWHGKAELWQLLQRSPQPPPHETLVVSLLHALRGQGYLLTLDDLQFVDEDPALAASIKRLSTAIDGRELALVATADRLPANIQVATTEVLGGLSPADMRLFLDAREVMLNERLATELHAKTGGNVELLNLAANVLQQAADPQRVIDRLAEAENIGNYLLNEVDQGLNGAERRVMGALAVLGGLPSRADAVEAVLDGDNPRRTLLKLSGRYLVTAHMGAAEQEYAVPAILQAFYYGEMGRRERTAMHARAGAYYVGEERDYLRAARHYCDAGELQRSAELATGHVRTIVNRGQVRALRSLLERFAPGQLPPLEWARVKVAHGEVCRILGDHAAVEAACREALRVLDQLQALSEAHVLYAQACRNTGLALQYEKPQEALDWLQRGMAHLEGLPAASPAAAAEAGLIQLHCGSLQIALGEFEAARAAVEAAIAQLPAEEEILLAMAYRNLGTIYSYQGDFAEAAHYNTLSLAISRRLHDDLNALAVLNNMGIDKEIAGDWQGAAADYAEALHLAHQLESVVDQVRIGNSLALLNIRRGNFDAAQQALAHAIGMAREHSIDEGLMYLLHTRAELELSRQEWDAAEQALAEAEGLAGDLDAPYVMVEVLTSEAQLALARGDAETALARVQRALELADELELEIEKGKALRVLGQVQMALGDTDAGLAAFAQSQELLADEPYEVARTRAAWGAALLATDKQQAFSLLEEAVEIFADLGAPGDHARAIALLQSPI